MVVVVGHRTAELAALARRRAGRRCRSARQRFRHPGARRRRRHRRGRRRDRVALLGRRAGCAQRRPRAQLYYGARNADALVDVGLFERLCSGIALATDDGSRGHRGYVTDLLQRESVRGTHRRVRADADAAQRCDGSAAARSARAAGARGAVRVRRRRVLGLRRADRPPQPPGAAFPAPPSGDAREYVHARICKEGPVFWAHDLRW